MKNLWKFAYRHARLLNLGTLHFTFPRKIAVDAVEFRDFFRSASMLPARQFKNLGYYQKGKRLAVCRGILP